MSIRRLAALMEMKSKTQLQRIVEDESSYRSIVRFAEQLEQTLGLSEAEKRERHRLLPYTECRPMSEPHGRRFARSLCVSRRLKAPAAVLL